jgi:hypothetical protein
MCDDAGLVADAIRAWHHDMFGGSTVTRR